MCQIRNLHEPTHSPQYLKFIAFSVKQTGGLPTICQNRKEYFGLLIESATDNLIICQSKNLTLLLEGLIIVIYWKAIPFQRDFTPFLNCFDLILTSIVNYLD